MKREVAMNLCRLAAVTLVLGAAAGCGRKGSLEPPPSATAQAKPEGEDQKSSGGLAGLRAKKPAPVLPSGPPDCRPDR